MQLIGYDIKSETTPQAGSRLDSPPAAVIRGSVPRAVCQSGDGSGTGHAQPPTVSGSSLRSVVSLKCRE